MFADSWFSSSAWYVPAGTVTFFAMKGLAWFVLPMVLYRIRHGKRKPKYSGPPLDNAMESLAMLRRR